MKMHRATFQKKTLQISKRRANSRGELAEEKWVHPISHQRNVNENQQSTARPDCRRPPPAPTSSQADEAGAPRAAAGTSTHLTCMAAQSRQLSSCCRATGPNRRTPWPSHAEGTGEQGNEGAALAASGTRGRTSKGQGKIPQFQSCTRFHVGTQTRVSKTRKKGQQGSPRHRPRGRRRWGRGGALEGPASLSFLLCIARTTPVLRPSIPPLCCLPSAPGTCRPARCQDDRRPQAAPHGRAAPPAADPGQRQPPHPRQGQCRSPEATDSVGHTEPPTPATIPTAEARLRPPPPHPQHCEPLSLPRG